MSKIESLTTEQWQRVYEERERWRAIGTCTEPADRATTERVISGFYRRLGKEPPRFVWLDGPLSCCVLGPLLAGAANLGDQLRAQPFAQLRGQLVNQLSDQLDDQLDDQLVNQLVNQFDDQLRGQLRDQLRQLDVQLGTQLRQLGTQLVVQLHTQLGVQLRTQLRDQLGGQLRGQLREAQLGKAARTVWRLRIWGAEYSWWSAWYATLRDVVGVTYPAEASALLDEWVLLQHSCGWWFPVEEVCFCAERHRTLSFDREYRLHAETGPAIECRDGVRVYSWHGTRIPAEWIEKPETLTPEVVFGVEGAEQRRAAAEILGWERILSGLDATKLDEHPDPEIGTLYVVDLPHAFGARILRMRCGTGRWFAQPVPETIATAMGAQEWIWRREPGGYRPEVRT